MPLVTISLPESFSPGEQRAVADGVHDAVVAVGFPSSDRFQKILRLPKEALIYDPVHPDLKEPRFDRFVLIELVISKGRTTEFKGDLLTHIAENLRQSPGIDPRDVMILIMETERESWAFSAGIQYYCQQH